MQSALRSRAQAEILNATSRATNDWEIMKSGAVILMLRVLKSLSGLVSARTFPSIALFSRQVG